MEEYKRDKKALNPQLRYGLKKALNIIKHKSYQHKSLNSPLNYLKKYYVLSHVLIYELLNSKIALLEIKPHKRIYKEIARRKLRHKKR